MYAEAQLMSILKNKTLLPEWHEQAYIMLCWPHLDSDWKNCIVEIERTYTELVANICQDQKTIILCFNKDLQQRVESIFQKNPNRKNIKYI